MYVAIGWILYLEGGMFYSLWQMQYEWQTFNSMQYNPSLN